jgi:hypothetical protein
MRTCFNNNALALAFLCISICSPPAFAATTLPPTSKQEAETKSQPTIHIKEPDYNFGQIMEGAAEVQHDFIVSNTGKEVLKIENVRVG